MQFYLDGYRPGDPLVEQPHPRVAARAGGSPRRGRRPDRRLRPGRAGARRAARRVPGDHDARHRPAGRPARRWARPTASPAGPSRCSRRSAWPTRLVDEAYWVNEVTFWRPGPRGPHADHAHRADPGRRGRPVGVPARHRQPGADARLPARVNGALGRAGCEPHYGLHAADVESTASGASDHPVTVTLQHLRTSSRPGRPRRSARSFVVGCDGARSGVRTAIGRELRGDPMNQSWGVMDVLAVTDFPDIRLKSAIHSANERQPADHPARGRLPGPALHRARRGRRPRDARDPQRHPGEARRRRQPGPAPVHARGQGRRLVVGLRDRPAAVRQVRRRPGGGDGTRLPRVFIAGDACHTHSAKAGQGMNVSMADAWNLGWKLAAVLRGTRAAGAAAHLLGRAPGRRPGADRLRPRVRDDVQLAAEGVRRRRGRGPGGVPALLRRRRAASPRASPPGTRRR